MKKLTLLMATLLLAMFSHAGDVIMYYTASASDIGSNTVKVNIRTEGINGESNEKWDQITMTKTTLSYNSAPVYQAKFSTPWGGFSTMQIQLWGDEWDSQVVPFDGSAWTEDNVINGKMYVHSTGAWVTPPAGAEVPETKYYIKNNWNGGEWTWQLMTKVTDDTYTYEDVFGGQGCNINTSENDGGAKWFAISDITVSGGSLIAGATAKFTYTVSANTLAAEITKAGEEKKIADGSDLYVMGNVNSLGWAANKGAKMTLADGKYTLSSAALQGTGDDAYFSFTTLLSAGNEDADWDAIAASRFGAEVNDYELTAGTAAKLLSGENAFKVPNGTYDITVDPAAMTVTVVKQGDLDPLTVDYYLVGYINGADLGCEADWENLGEYKFVNGKVSVTFTVGDADYGKNYVFVKTSDNKKWYMAADYVETSPATLALSVNGEDGTPSQKVGITELGTYTFTLTENTDGTLTLAFSKSGTTPDDPDPKDPDDPETPDTKVYVMGAVRGTNYTWAANLGEEMTYANGKYTLTTHIANDGTADLGYFAFTTKLADGNEEADWAAIATYRFGVETEDTEAAIGVETALVSATNGYKIAAGTYSLTVDLNAKTYLITESTAVENVEALSLQVENGTILSDGTLRIFTVTGQDVTAQNGNLQGLYIVTVNGTAAKVLVR